MPHVNRIARLTVAVALVAAVAACSSTSAAPVSVPSDPAVDAAEATRIADTAFRGYNDGDYAAWTNSWSDAMRSAIKESDFAAVRRQLLGAVGRYVSLSEPVLGSTQAGTYGWTFQVTFEKGTRSYRIVFYDNSSEVDGVHFE